MGKKKHHAQQQQQHQQPAAQAQVEAEAASAPKVAAAAAASPARQSTPSKAEASAAASPAPIREKESAKEATPAKVPATPVKTATPAKASATPVKESASTPAAADSASGHKRKQPSVLSEEEQDALDRKLHNRPDADHLRSTGVIKAGGILAENRSKLQREFNHSALQRALDHRSSEHELVHAGVLGDPHLAPSLQSTAKRLEKNMIANKLNEAMAAREPIVELEARGIARAGDVAPALRSAKIALQHAITRDHVAHLLEQRPELEELRRAAVIGGPGDFVAPSLQRVQRKLARSLTENKVAHLLEQRAPREELERAGVLPRTGVSGAGAEGVGVAPALQGVQRTLERQLTRSNLFHALTGRPQIDELYERGIWREAQTQQQQQQQQQAEKRQQQARAQYLQQQQQQQQQSARRAAAPSSSSSTSTDSPAGRSRAFHLTRLLLKLVSTLSESGSLSLLHKSNLKDLIVDQDVRILAVAERFQQTQNAEEIKRSMLQLAGSRR